MKAYTKKKHWKEYLQSEGSRRQVAGNVFGNCILHGRFNQPQSRACSTKNGASRDMLLDILAARRC